MTSSDHNDQRLVAPTGRLKQGDILRGLEFVALTTHMRDGGGNFGLWSGPETPWHILLTQDCDLEQNESAELGQIRSDKRLWGILLAPGWNVDDVEGRRHLNGVGYEDLVGAQKMGRTEAEYLRTNRLERWYYVAPHARLGGVGVAFDFKLTTTVHPRYLKHALEIDPEMRAGTLGGVWANHLAHRYITFLGRVPLPDDD